MTLTEVLARFDRKERNWLVRDALGTAASRLDEGFRAKIEKEVRRRDDTFRMEPGAWWAIDYHIDWLIAALYVLQHGVPMPKETNSNDSALIEGHQQDIDLVIASGDTLILIEVKGVGSWGKGLDAKVERLHKMTRCAVVGDDGRSGGVALHFVLCSPKRLHPKGAGRWPKWMTSNSDQEPLWIALDGEKPSGGFLKVERCNEHAHKAEKGGRWQILPDQKANSYFKESENIDEASAP